MANKLTKSVENTLVKGLGAVDTTVGMVDSVVLGVSKYAKNFEEDAEHELVKSRLIREAELEVLTANKKELQKAVKEQFMKDLLDSL